MDEAQLAEQEALRKQLQQEQDLLQQFQERQEIKLLDQHDKEKKLLDEKVEASKRELEKQVQYNCYVCTVVVAVAILACCYYCCLTVQIFEESTKLQNLRLERQQQLQRKHLKEWKDFAEKYSSDRISLNSEVMGQDFERSSTSRVSLGTSLL